MDTIERPSTSILQAAGDHSQAKAAYRFDADDRHHRGIASRRNLVERLAFAPPPGAEPAATAEEALEVVGKSICRWPIETTFQRGPFLARAGDAAGLEPVNLPAGDTVLVLPVYRGDVVVLGSAPTVRASAGGGFAGEVRGDVLGCHHRRAALAMGGMGS